MHQAAPRRSRAIVNTNVHSFENTTYSRFLKQAPLKMTHRPTTKRSPNRATTLEIELDSCEMSIGISRGKFQLIRTSNSCKKVMFLCYHERFYTDCPLYKATF